MTPTASAIMWQCSPADTVFANGSSAALRMRVCRALRGLDHDRPVTWLVERLCDIDVNSADSALDNGADRLEHLADQQRQPGQGA